MLLAYSIFAALFMMLTPFRQRAARYACHAPPQMSADVTRRHFRHCFAFLPEIRRCHVSPQRFDAARYLITFSHDYAVIRHCRYLMICRH